MTDGPLTSHHVHVQDPPAAIRPGEAEEPAAAGSEATRRLWVGTYAGDGNGAPAGREGGIWRVDLDLRARRLGEPRLVAPSPAASFLAEHPSGRMLYALSETAPGTVRAFPVDDRGHLGPPTVVPSGGDGPCHLLLTGRALYVAHYGDGSLAVHLVAPDGTFAGDGPAQVHAAPLSAPGDVSRAHFAAIAPDGRHLLVCDLGLDVLRRYRVEPDGLLTDDGVAARLPQGTGPRHLALGADGLVHVVGELDATLTTLSWDPATAEASVVAVVDLAPASRAPGAERAYPGHVIRDERGVHASVRGPDEIVTVPAAVVSGADGELRHRTSGGSWPRHFAAVDDLLVVATERSDRLTLLDRDGTELDSAPVPRPACVLPSVDMNT